MATLQVDLQDRSYPIYIEAGLFNKIDLLTRHIHGKRVCIISNNIVKPLYLSALKDQLISYELDEVILPDGESEKSLANFKKSCLIYLKMGMDVIVP